MYAVIIGNTDPAEAAGSRGGLPSCPRTIRAEAPEVPLGVTDGVPAGAVVRVLELHHDLGARGLRARVVRVHVLDVDVHSLLHGVPGVVGAGPVLSREADGGAGARGDHRPRADEARLRRDHARVELR